MFIPFEKLPVDARVWVYQSNQELQNNELAVVETALEKGVSQWQAHGVELVGSFKVLHNRFVIVAVDENQNLPSGCSIDASTRWLKELSQQLNLDFFDRQVYYLSKENIASFNPLQAKKTIESGQIQPDTIVFDALVNTVNSFNEGFEKPASETWMKRFFKSTEV